MKFYIPKDDDFLEPKQWKWAQWFLFDYITTYLQSKEGRQFRAFGRFVLRHEHEVKHGLQLCGYEVECGYVAASDLKATAKMTVKRFGVSTEIAESACIVWCFRCFAALASREGEKRTVAMARDMEAETKKRHAADQLPVSANPTEVPTPEEMIQSTGMTMIESDGWTWPAPNRKTRRQIYRRAPRALAKMPPSSIQPGVENVRPAPTVKEIPATKRPRKAKTHLKPVAKTIPQKPPAPPAAEWTADEMQSCEDRERQEEWQTILKCVELIRAKNRASVTMLQTGFGFPYKKSARIIGKLEKFGVIGPSNGVDARSILKLPAKAG